MNILINQRLSVAKILLADIDQLANKSLLNAKMQATCLLLYQAWQCVLLELLPEDSSISVLNINTAIWLKENKNTALEVAITSLDWSGNLENMQRNLYQVSNSQNLDDSIKLSYSNLSKISAGLYKFILSIGELHLEY